MPARITPLGRRNLVATPLFLLTGDGIAKIKDKMKFVFFTDFIKVSLDLIILALIFQLFFIPAAHAKIYLSITKTTANSGCKGCYEVEGNMIWTPEEDGNAVPQEGHFPTWTLQSVVNGEVQPLFGAGFPFCKYQGYATVGEVRRACNRTQFSQLNDNKTGQPPIGASFCFRILDGNDMPLPANVITWECAPLPPPDITCDIGGPYTIDFGTVDVTSLSGRARSINVRASCTSNVSATIKLIPSDGKNTVTLLPGLFGTLSVDGQPGATGSRKTVGPAGANFELTTTLQTSGTVAPGIMRGSAIVRIEVN